MKKIIKLMIVLSITIITSLISYKVFAYNLIDENTKTFVNFDSQCELDINVLRGNPDFTKSKLYSKYQEVSSLIDKGSISETYLLDVDQEQHLIWAGITINDSKITNVSIEYDDEEIYLVTLAEDEYNVKINQEILFLNCACIDIYDGSFNMNLTLFNNTTSNNNKIKNTLNGVLPLIGIYVNYINNTNNHIITSYLNPKSLDDIVKDIKVFDQTDYENCEKFIYETNYEIKDNKIEVGTYYIIVGAKDKSGNVTLEKIYVDTIDITPPTIKVYECSSSYTKKIEDYSEYYEVADDSGIKEINIISDDYSNNYNKIGSYKITFEAIDNNDNAVNFYITINVIDDVEPVITIPTNFSFTTLDNYTLDDILDMISVYDFIDDEIIVKLYDLDDYIDNKRKIGEYKFKVTAVDNSDNERELNFTIYVYDKDYPVLSYESYVIAVPKDYVMTMEEMKNILINAGQINDTNVSLESDYFTVDKAVESYNLYVSTEDTLYKNVIVSDNDNIKYDNIETIIPKKDRSYLIVFGIIGGLVVILATSLGIVAYKKRH